MGFNTNFLLSCLLMLAVHSFVFNVGDAAGRGATTAPTTSTLAGGGAAASTATMSPSSASAGVIEEGNPFFQLDFYRASCPEAEEIIKYTVTELFINKPTDAPDLIGLLFHDCFIMGCDGSLLLNSTNGVQSEKDIIPNQSLKGFDVIEEIKSRLESVCPRTVSCSDILVLAARESVRLSGGPFYPLRTGRRDSLISFPQIALMELPAPDDDLDTIMHKFSSKHFSESETVSLLGAHNIGGASDKFLFTKDFPRAMMKLSDLGVLTGPLLGQIRQTCSATL